MNYRSIIESKYNRQNWQSLLSDIFRKKIQFWQSPKAVKIDETVATTALYIGKIALTDGNIIAVYEVELCDSVQIERNRTSIRNLLCSNWRGMGCAGAFMFCYKKDEAVLRFSYVSESIAFCENGLLTKTSTDTKRFTYLLGEGHRSRTANEQFVKLKKSKQTLNDVTKAFSVEALSEIFFSSYKKQYEDIIEYITGKRMVKVSNKWKEVKTGTPCIPIMNEFNKFEDPEKSVRDYVKKLMGRLVFIQFLQKKGWMGVPGGDSWSGGDNEFLQNLFLNSSYKDSFVDDVLEPLFDDLNNRRDGDIVSNENVGINIKVPYLNGGLFEKDDFDKTQFPLPSKYMKQLLDFFSSYNFTIDENDPNDAQVGVDPEMLGRIFENLLEDNKDKGAFYTPKEIVQYMCKQSLITYLNTEIESPNDKHSVESFVNTYNVEYIGGCDSDLALSIDKKLKEVKICDPAIGSGAFPMGLLKELFLCRGAIEHFNNSAEIKRHIIQQNIYGVDIEKGAVDIARLRFWLSLIVDEETPHSLPNLDYKIMQGNSLLESFMGYDLSTLTETDKAIAKRNKGQTTLMFDEADTKRNIQVFLDKYYNESNHDSKVSIRQAIKSTIKEHIKICAGYSPSVVKAVDDLQIPNDQFFLWHTWFKDVFSQQNGKSGFDIVIGNPPYFLYQESHIGEIKDLRNDKDYTIAFGGKLNAYKLFIANAIKKLLGKNGVNCFIFQNSFLCDRQATNLRKYILSNNKIIKIDSYPERDSKKKRVFESVKMSVCIVLVQNSHVKSNYVFPVSIWDDKNRSTGLNTYFSLDNIKAIDKIDFSIPRLHSEYIPLVIKLSRKRELVIKCIEGELNVTSHKKYFGQNTNNPLILKGASIQKYYYTLQMSQGQIDYIDEKKYLNDCGSTEKSTHHKYERIAMQGMTGANDKNRLFMSIIPKGCYLANSCNYILPIEQMDLYCLLGFMNSKVINWFFRCFSTNSNVNGYEVDNLPVPLIEKEQQNAISEIVKQISTIKLKNQFSDTSDLEHRIDTLVYQAYELTDEEISMIER